MIESRARSGAAPVPGWMDEAQLTPAEDFETEVASGRVGALGPSLPHLVSLPVSSLRLPPHHTLLQYLNSIAHTHTQYHRHLFQFSSHDHVCKGFLIYYDGKLQQKPKVTLLLRPARDKLGRPNSIYSRNHLCNSTKEPVQ